MGYQEINWENLPSTKTPIDAENLKHMDGGIAQAHEAIRLLELYKANSIKKNLSGEVITSKDCAQVPPLGIKLFGKGTQRQFEGNQLFDDSKALDNSYQNSDFVGGSYAITVNNNYWCTGLQMVKPNTVYSYTTNGFAGGLFYVDENTPITTTKPTKSQPTFTTPENANYVSLSYEKATTPFGANIMLNEGNLLKDYEPFVGGEQSPSINYPQTPVFHGESGSIEGKLLTKNYADFRNLNYTEKGVIVTGDENGVITLNGTPTISEGYIFTIMKPCNPKSFIIGERYVTNEGIRFVDNGTVYYSTNFVMKESITEISVYLQRNVERYVNGEVIKPILCMEKDNINDWQPYTEQPFTELTPNGLKGVPLYGDTGEPEPTYIDVFGKPHYADYKDFNGNVQAITEVVLTGTESIVLRNTESLENPTNKLFQIQVDSSGTYLRNYLYKVPYILRSVLSNSYRVGKEYASVWNEDIKGIHLFDGEIWIRDSFETVEDFKAKLAELYANGTPVKVYVPLANPITTEQTAEELDQYNSLVMNYPITNVVNDAGAYMEVEYVADTQEYIEQNYVSIDKYNEHENRIAEIEKAMVNS